WSVGAPNRSGGATDASSRATAGTCRAGGDGRSRDSSGAQPPVSAATTAAMVDPDALVVTADRTANRGPRAAAAQRAEDRHSFSLSPRSPRSGGRVGEGALLARGFFPQPYPLDQR